MTEHDALTLQEADEAHTHLVPGPSSRLAQTQKSRDDAVAEVLCLKGVDVSTPREGHGGWCALTRGGTTCDCDWFEQKGRGARPVVE